MYNSSQLERKHILIRKTCRKVSNKVQRNSSWQNFLLSFCLIQLTPGRASNLLIFVFVIRFADPLEQVLDGLRVPQQPAFLVPERRHGQDRLKRVHVRRSDPVDDPEQSVVAFLLGHLVARQVAVRQKQTENSIKTFQTSGQRPCLLLRRCEFKSRRLLNNKYSAWQCQK